jgi:predicted metal-dependent phosphoesterase TrpH
MHLDLHLHSTCSDGALSPANLVAAARRAGLEVIALADHDTVAGTGAARAAAAAQGGIEVLQAIEITCFRDDTELHLLGYAFRADDAGIAALTARAGEARRERLAAMVDRLRTLGVDVSVGEVVTEPECASVGRMHLARTLVRRGAAGSVSEAFARYLGDRAAAYVPSRGPAVAEAIAAVRSAGGLAVWAHPALEDARHFDSLRDCGLEGVEVLRPSLAPVESVALEQAARAAGLVATGGSDWHGGVRPALGSWYVTERHVGPFLERLGMGVSRGR